MKNLLFVFLTFFMLAGSTTSSFGQLRRAEVLHADPRIAIDMVPSILTINKIGRLQVLLGNGANDSILNNTMHVTISMSMNGQIMGIDTATSDPRWTLAWMDTTDTGNTVHLKNTGGNFGPFDTGFVNLIIKANVVTSHFATIGSYIVYQTGGTYPGPGYHPDLGGAPNSTQGNMSVQNDNSISGLLVKPLALPPVAQNIVNAPLNNSVGQTHIGSFAAADPQGDSILSYKVTTLPLPGNGVLYTCSNNTVPCTGSYTAVTINQVLTPLQAASLYFYPANTFIGTSTFTYTATSINGTSNVATETIPVFNNPPTANSVTVGIAAMNSTVNPIPPLTGADGDGTVVSFTVSPPSAAQGTITYCTTPPSGGCGTPISGATLLTPAQITSINFKPATGFTGFATFPFTTTDNNGNISTPATVMIPVTTGATAPSNLPPITQNITSAPINSNSGITPIVPLIGTDPDGTIANFTIVTLPTVATGVLYYCTTGNVPCTGTLTPVSVNQVLTPAQAASLQFTPTAGNNNPAVFTYGTTDNLGLTGNISKFTIPVTNIPPTAVSLKMTIPFGRAKIPVLPLQGNDEGNIVTYTITVVPNRDSIGILFICSNNTVPCTGVYAEVTAGQVLTPTQVAALTFTAVNGYTGTANAKYTVTDNNGAVSVPADLDLVINDYGVIGLSPISKGSNVTMGANGGIKKLPSNFITGNDPDGAILSYTIISLPPVNQGVYTYCTTPPSGGCGKAVTVGLLTPAQAATISFTPNASFTGSSLLSFIVTDTDENISDMAVSQVSVASQPPLAKGYTVSPVSMNGGSQVATPLLATDLLDSGAVVSYTIRSLPPIGNGSLKYCVSPPSGGCGTAITVGQVLTPAQAATVVFVPSNTMKLYEVPFTFTATDNSGNISNLATIIVPVVNAMVLPVKLTSFTAVLDNNCAANVRWTTSMEQSLNKFVIEYSNNGVSFKDISSHTSKNNSNGASYNYQYMGLQQGVGYFRLRIVEADGTYSFSNVVTVRANCNNEVYTISPNPAINKVTISSATDAPLKVLIFNQLGQLVKQVNLAKGVRSLYVNDIVSGIYMVQLFNDTQLLYTMKLTKL